MPWARLVSALVLAPPVLFAVYSGYPAFHAVLAIVCAILAWEWARMCDLAGAVPTFILAVAALALPAGALAATVPGVFWGLAVGVAVATIAGLAVPAVRSKGRNGLIWLALGVIAIGLPAGALVLLRDSPGDGAWLVLWLLAVVWTVDVAAFVSGRLIGGSLLAPRISPKKTWSGLIGGVSAAAFVGGAAAVVAGFGDPLPWAVGAAALGFVEQGGDLLESAMKRHFGRKDSSNLIPGHGGLMDRVDGLWPSILILWVVRAVLP